MEEEKLANKRFGSNEICTGQRRAAGRLRCRADGTAAAALQLDEGGEGGMGQEAVRDREKGGGEGRREAPWRGGFVPHRWPPP